MNVLRRHLIFVSVGSLNFRRRNNLPYPHYSALQTIYIFQRSENYVCNSWLTNRLRKEPQVVEMMVLRWNEILTNLTAQAHARETCEKNENAEKNRKSEPAVSQV